jgi:hypothetical protein
MMMFNFATATGETPQISPHFVNTREHQKIHARVARTARNAALVGSLLESSCANSEAIGSAKAGINPSHVSQYRPDLVDRTIGKEGALGKVAEACMLALT